MGRNAIVGAVAVSVSLASIAILATVIWIQRPSESDALNNVLPELVPAPTGGQQTQLLAAMKAHPNPPLSVDQLPALGSDAKGLATLFAAMASGKADVGITWYYFELAASPGQDERDNTFVFIEVAGDPPRVIRRRIETAFSP